MKDGSMAEGKLSPRQQLWLATELRDRAMIERDKDYPADAALFDALADDVEAGIAPSPETLAKYPEAFE
jgi:hypothetical protein